MKKRIINYYIFIIIVLLFCINYLVIAQTRVADEVKQCYFTEERLAGLHISNIIVDTKKVSNGIHGCLFHIYFQKTEGNFIADRSYELFVQLEDRIGEEVRASAYKGIYSSKSGKLICRKPFRLSRFYSFWRDVPETLYEITDQETKEVRQLSAKRESAPLKVFLPYYAIALPAGRHSLTAQIYVRALIDSFSDTTATRLYERPSGQTKIQFTIEKPAIERIRLSISEVGVDSLDAHGAYWDWAIKRMKQPDLQWSISLESNYQSETIFISEVATNTYHHKWPITYSHVFAVSKGDLVHINILDDDWWKASDTIGVFRVSVAELTDHSIHQEAIQFDKVAYMRVNKPHVMVQARLETVKLNQHKNNRNWDIRSSFFDTKPPDIYCHIRSSNGKLLYHSTVYNNSYEANWERAYFNTEAATEDTLFIDIYDSDFLLSDDLIGTIDVPLIKLIDAGGHVHLTKKNIGEVVIFVK